MIITKERTRLIFTEYTPLEKRRLEDLVASIDNVFLYQDPDDKMIGMPTGMEKTIRRLFSKSQFIDNSSKYWEYAKIQPVHHEAEPRNQLQVDFINFLLEHAKKKDKVAGILSPGTGKLNPNSTKIPTPDGYKLMGDIKVGDKVFDERGRVTIVTNVYPQGIKDIYKITFNDGRYSLCGAEHLWLVKTYPQGKYKTLRTIDMINDFKMEDKTKKERRESGVDCDINVYRYRIPVLSGPVQYNHKDVPVHPYVVGALIGNGCLTLPGLSISSGNDFVPLKIANLCGFKTKKAKSNYTYNFYKDNDLVHTKDFLKDLPEILDKYSYEKVIPEVYIFNDVETRIQLLQGLMDADGSITYNEGRFTVSYSSCSKVLLKQIQYVIQSLGFNCTIGIDKRVCKYTKGFHGELRFLVPNSFKKNLFSYPPKRDLALLASKKEDTNLNKDHLLIKDIKLVSREEATCIAVDNPTHLYVTEQFIVTHNTFMACYSAIKVGLRTLIIVPTSGIKKQWGETLTDMFNVDPSRVKLITKPQDFVNVKADFVVVSQASLSVLNKKYDLEKIMQANKFGIKVIDEVQMWFHNIIKVDANSCIAHNWYLTGTFGRSGDTENNLYQEMFGDLSIFREEQKKPTIFNRKPGNIYGMKPHMHVTMMWTKSGLSPEEIKSVTSSMRYSEREGKWIRYGISIPAYTELVIPSDGTMTRFLSNVLKTVEIAMKEIDYGKTLILTPTIASVNIIAGYVEKMFPDLNVGTFNSRNSAAENDRMKAECDILVSTVKSCGTGFDVKGLSRLIVAEQFKSWILTDQVSGRLRRRDDGKDTYMWDIVDSQIPQLRSWANARADVLRRKAKTFKVKDM